MELVATVHQMALILVNGVVIPIVRQIIRLVRPVDKWEKFETKNRHKSVERSSWILSSRDVWRTLEIRQNMISIDQGVSSRQVPENALSQWKRLSPAQHWFVLTHFMWYFHIHKLSASKDCGYVLARLLAMVYKFLLHSFGEYAR